MPRLFTAIEVPPDVGIALTGLRGGLPRARWVDPANYHLTLRFIGDVDMVAAEEAAAALWRVDRGPIEIRIAGVDALGSRRPSAIVARIAPTPPLMELQAEHERLFQRIGLEPEGRKYTPHITVARLDHHASSRDIAEYLGTRGGFAGPSFSAERFVLYSARDSVGGGPYVVEEAYPLAPAGRHAMAAGR